jgi:hypothetical protein
MKTNSLKATCEIHYIGPVVNVSKKATEFFKQTVVLNDPDEHPDYPNFLVFEVAGKNISKMEGRSVGETVTLSFELKGRAWGDKWFCNAEVWKVDVVASAKPANPPNNEPDNADIPF